MSRWLARELAKNDKTLIGFWPFQDNLFDYSGLAAHGKAVGGTATSVYAQQPYLFYKSGRRGTCIGQYSSDLFVDIGPVPDYNFDYTNDFTISCWYYHSGISNNGQGALIARIYQPSYGINTGYELKVSNDKVTFGLYYQNYYSCSSAVAFNGATEKWYHIVIVYEGINDPSHIKIYINGILQPPIATTNTLTFSIYSPSGRLQIGNGINKLSSVTNAGIALARIWKRELSQREVCQLYYKEKDLSRPRPKGMRPAFSNNLPLFIKGPIQLNNSLPLIINGPSGASNFVPLNIYGYNSGNLNTTLFIYGSQPINNNIPLYISGVWAIKKGLNLFLNCATRLFSNSVRLNIAGNSVGANGLVKWTPLTISGVPYSRNINLFLAGTLIDKSVRNMNLFVSGRTTLISNFAPLVLQNTQLGLNNNIPLLTIGSGDPYARPPGTLYGSALNLFIKRWPSNAVPLFLSCSSPANASIPMFVRGTSVQTGSTPLAVPNTIGIYDKQPVPLYVSGY